MAIQKIQLEKCIVNCITKLVCVSYYEDQKKFKVDLSPYDYSINIENILLELKVKLMIKKSIRLPLFLP